MDDQFGFWLSGFIDGEGCFQVTKSNDSYWCRFHLTQRDDDADLLHVVRSETGLGTIQTKPARDRSKPQVTWTIQKKSDCLKLVSILTKYPLRSRKRRDFFVWQGAVEAWALPEGYKRLPGFKTRLIEARTYRDKQALDESAILTA